MFKIIETFSGIGAQAKAFERLGVEHEVLHTCDWDIGAIIAYCQIHKGKIDVSKYSDVTDEEIEEYLSGLTLSIDGKKPIQERTFGCISNEVKRIIYTAIKETNNFVSITDVTGKDIEEDIDLLTYSFPCQDLSMCGYWHGNTSGISRDAHNRSGMLWEVERILDEMNEQGKRLPKFLVMENVTNILSVTHEKDFNEWKSKLGKLGYYNKIYRLNARNFGVPQKRERAYMISIRIDDDICKLFQLENYFAANNLEDIDIANKYKYRKFKLKDVLRIDYDNSKYLDEANINQPNDTPSRQKIFEENDMLYDGKKINEICVNTITTKQDRNPNSGLITYNSGNDGKVGWRYLTPRECFMLMGFDEVDYDKVIEQNSQYIKGKSLLTNEKLHKMAGNSICVDVLVAIFKQIIEINNIIFK